LLNQALRDSPDVLVVGESRGADVVHLLDAASNGIAGVMCTIHAASARGVFDRLVQMVRKAAPPLPGDYALHAATALDVIVHVARTREHERFVTEVVQVHSGALGENGRPVTEQLFTPRRDGRAVPTGFKPTPELAERLAGVGFDLDWLNPGTDTWDEQFEQHRRRA
ncbi:MAG: ATPase, T2SS/T4P/T4SS family, partial [Dermatophilaceae bacterium]